MIPLPKQESRPETASEWLLRVRELARKLNFESKFDVRKDIR